MTSARPECGEFLVKILVCSLRFHGASKISGAGEISLRIHDLQALIPSTPCGRRASAERTVAVELRNAEVWGFFVGVGVGRARQEIFDRGLNLHRRRPLGGNEPLAVGISEL